MAYFLELTEELVGSGKHKEENKVVVSLITPVLVWQSKLSSGILS